MFAESGYHYHYYFLNCSDKIVYIIIDVSTTDQKPNTDNVRTTLDMKYMLMITYSVVKETTLPTIIIVMNVCIQYNDLTTHDNLFCSYNNE